jgi:uncharacterized protein (TIGR01777 family)
MKILVTGASGLVGQALGIALTRQGHELVVVSRAESQRLAKELPYPFCHHIQVDFARGGVERPEDLQSLEDVEVVINLMGENIGQGPWSEERKKAFWQSRVEATKNLRQAWSRLPNSRLRLYIGASAVGYYGDTGNKSVDESSEAGTGFLSELTQAWEAAHQEWQSLPISPRVTRLRLGVVHALQGGALATLAQVIRLGGAVALGSGDQLVSWVDLEDVVGVVEWLLAQERNQILPVYNVVSPEVLTHKKWMQAIAEAMDAWMWPMGLPSFVARMALRQQADMFLLSQGVKPQALLQQGYPFRRQRLSESLGPVKKAFSIGRHYFQAQQWIAAPLEQVFPFFADAKNLERMTPEFLHFKIRSQSTPQIEKGTEFVYTIKIHGVPVKWRTLITRWEPPYLFADNQEQGPYHTWYHEHEFEALAGGTLMTDRVHYSLPLEPLGHLAAGWMVHQDVRKIFSYRRQVISDYFAKTR